MYKEMTRKQNIYSKISEGRGRRGTANMQSGYHLPIRVFTRVIYFHLFAADNSIQASHTVTYMYALQINCSSNSSSSILEYCAQHENSAGLESIYFLKRHFITVLINEKQWGIIRYF